MTCCTSTLSQGCYNSCDIIQIFTSSGGIVQATQTGTFSILLVDTMRIIATFDLTIGDVIAFTNPFNEDTTSVFQILNPDLTVFSVSGSDCMSIKISPPNNPSLASTDIDCGEVTITSGCDGSTITTVSCPGTYAVPCITDLDGGTPSAVPAEYGDIDGGTP